jgi:deazaflavin-dependent oxidoreductase (nitroreductase family)
MSDESTPPASDWNLAVIEEFRANGGVVGGPFTGAPLLLLTTRGAKSGARRVSPMMYLEEDGTIYVFASKAGADHSPDWFHNLVATPEVQVELGSETFEAVATPLEGDERTRVYEVQASRFPQFADYQAKTSRVIPVVKLVKK